MAFPGELNAAVKRQDGIAVARLLSITNVGIVQIAQSTNEASVNRDITSKFRDALWGDIAVAYWRVAVQVGSKQDLVGAYTAQNVLLTIANRAAEKTDNWVLPVLYTIAKELRQIAVMADKQLSSNDHKVEEAMLEKATRTINRSFTICLNDRNTELSESKTWGTYFFVGELFKVYFRLGNHSLAKSVVKVLNSKEKDLPPLAEFPKAYIVTFLYYLGVLHFIDENYKKAEDKLGEALRLCHRNAAANRESILTYLIPAKIMASGALPRAEYLAKHYPKAHRLFTEPDGIVESLRAGDVSAFDSAVARRRDILVRKSLYLCTERLRVLAALRLLRKVHHAHGAGNRVPTSWFAAGLRLKGYFEDPLALEDEPQETEDPMADMLDETEALIATLMAQGRIKGYISHDRRTVVLSNSTPFPPASTNC
ncbi:hypothetical protein TRVA0_010S00386 [Trichomonascus vanleenenianus]|uniref:uncharacterized protein n=1 Tax=Trichomonascus vanleenenianus TaxID=2268995 RepID=UPI003ECA54C1